MKVKILLFAQLKDHFGTSERTVDVSVGSTVSDLKQTLFDDGDSQKFESLPYLYAVNDTWAQGSKTLNPDDVVAFLPPVSGG